MIARILGILVLLVLIQTQTVFGQVNRKTIDSQEDISQQEYLYAFTEATKYFIFGNYAQAVSLYNECLKIKPNSSAVHFQLSKIYLNAGNTDIAREHAKKAVLLDGSNKWYLQQLGNIFQLEQKWDSARRVFENLLKIDRGDVDVMFSIATLLEKEGKYSEGLKYLSAIDSVIGNSKEVSLARYRMLENSGKSDKALIELRKAGSFDDDYAVSGMMAEYFKRHHNIDSADTYYRKIYPAYYKDPAVVFSYAEYLKDNGKIDSAKVVLLKALADSSIDNMSKARYFYNILQNDKEFLRNRTILDTISQVFYNTGYNDIRVASIFADIQLRLRNYEKASTTLKRIVSNDETNYPAIEQLIYTLNLEGKPDSVIYYCKYALRKFSEKPLIYLFYGSACYQKKDYSSGIVFLKKGLELTTDSNLKVEFYSILAECYQNLKQYEDSENAFKATLLIDDKNLIVKNNYAYYLSLRGKELKKARKLSLSTIKAEPENSTFLDTYAWILYEMGKRSEAKRYILRAIQYGGVDNKDILIHSAQIHASLKEYASAIGFYKSSLKFCNDDELKSIKKEIEYLETIRND